LEHEGAKTRSLNRGALQRGPSRFATFALRAGFAFSFTFALHTSRFAVFVNLRAFVFQTFALRGLR
jgi:hypothetical protein